MQSETLNTFNEKNNILSEKLKEYLGNSKPIFVCVGSDLVLGDSLGPLVGTMLKQNNLNAYIYGTLNFPITAKEIEYAKKYIKIMHKNSKIIVIDASIGDIEDVGTVKIKNSGIKPGLGVNKDLECIGDVSIIGIVASKSKENINLYNLTRLNLVYKMAEVICNGIIDYVKNSEIINTSYSFCTLGYKNNAI